MQNKKRPIVVEKEEVHEYAFDRKELNWSHETI